MPSQIFPDKLNMQFTRDILSEKILGSHSAEAGFGSAGAAIGDGYRIAGIWGVPLLASIFGVILGLTERFVIGTSIWHLDVSIFRIAIFAGLCGWTFLIIRSDLAELLQTILYNSVLPLLVVSALLPGEKHGNRRPFKVPRKQD